MPRSEAETRRELIDPRLEAAGWIVQDRAAMSLYAGRGVAVREFPLETGYADYLLFVDRKAVGIVEAKAEGIPLAGVAEQAAQYAAGLPANIPHVELPLPFMYESSGVETFFRDNRDPQPRSRRVFSFHRPRRWRNGLRSRIRCARACERCPKSTPYLPLPFGRPRWKPSPTWKRSFAADKPRALIQMATGSGKTFTAVNFVYRLVKHCRAKRVLFLVDRNNLGKQTFKEFDQFITPDDGRKFTELVQRPAPAVQPAG